MNIIQRKKIMEKKVQKYYDVKVEAMVPAIITYSILAENEEEAMEKYEKNNLPIFEIKYELVRRKENVASVYDKGTINLRMKKKV